MVSVEETGEASLAASVEEDSNLKNAVPTSSTSTMGQRFVFLNLIGDE